MIRHHINILSLDILRDGSGRDRRQAKTFFERKKGGEEILFEKIMEVKIFFWKRGGRNYSIQKNAMRAKS